MNGVVVPFHRALPYAIAQRPLALSVHHCTVYRVPKNIPLDPDLKMAGMNIALAKNNLKLTTANYLPVLSLQVSKTPAQDLLLNAWG
jgi:hypothetical protein